MELQGARELMENLLSVHGLTKKGWQGRFDEAKKRFGVCRIRKKIISLSRPLVLLNPEEEVRDTILHEIAHALAWERHGEIGHHDARWKAICREIGARPVATYDEEVIQPDLPWVLRHRKTGEVFASFTRKPTGNPAEIWIRGRKRETLGQLEYALNPDHGEKGKLERFDRAIISELQKEIMSTLEALSEKWSITVEKTSGHFSAAEYLLQLKFEPAGGGGRSLEERDFAEAAALFDLTPEDYKRVFFFHEQPFQLVALKPRNRKYPIIGLGPNGNHYKFPREVLKGLTRLNP
jgi:hypothetical protein